MDSEVLNSQVLFSSSDYQTAKDCTTKLFYKRSSYKSNATDDEYLQMLAEGGFAIKKMARLLYEGGIPMDLKDPFAAAKQTAELLKQENVVIFDACFIVDHKFAKIDILSKAKKQINLIKVQVKGVNSADATSPFWNKRGTHLKAEWISYLEDFAFNFAIGAECIQRQLVLADPKDFCVDSYFLLPDKNSPCKTDGFAKQFIFHRNILNAPSVEDVEFIGDLELLKQEKLLTLLSVNKELEEVAANVKSNTANFLKLVYPKLERKQASLNRKCRQCEFRLDTNLLETTKDGYSECWGTLAKAENHIFDLYLGGGNQVGELVDNLIQDKKITLNQIPLESLWELNSQRQVIQIQNTLNNTEWQDPHLNSILQELELPLHFIDFETYQSAIPYHRGMKPYEKIAFQWSCHTVDSLPNNVYSLIHSLAEPKHTEFLNLENVFPNFAFAEKLMQTLDSNGTILVWSQYENSILRDIYHQIEEYGPSLGYYNEELKHWISNTASLVKGEKSPKMLDMNDLCLKYFFHPEMKGKTSIKYVLPAIWNNNHELHKIPWLKKYYSQSNGEILNPYDKLKEIEIAGKAESVREGTGAMRAYEEMIYGDLSDNVAVKKQWAQLLKSYCKLDTLAMVIIWLHWRFKGASADSGSQEF